MNDAVMAATLSAGLADPVFDSQRVFRATLEAFSHPGRIVTIDTAVPAPAPLTPEGPSGYLRRPRR